MPTIFPSENSVEEVKKQLSETSEKEYLWIEAFSEGKDMAKLRENLDTVLQHLKYTYKLREIMYYCSYYFISVFLS